MGAFQTELPGGSMRVTHGEAVGGAQTLNAMEERALAHLMSGLELTSSKNIANFQEMSPDLASIVASLKSSGMAFAGDPAADGPDTQQQTNRTQEQPPMPQRTGNTLV